MSDQERGSKWAADDVEGHRFRGGVTDEAAQDEDVEGHGARWGGVTDEAAQDDDVEGHSMRGRVFTDESHEHRRGTQFSSGALGGEDDVEGHAFRGNATEEAAQDDDVEGHAARIKM